MTDMQDFKYKDKTPSEVLVELATQHGMNVHDEEFHKILDDGDELSKFRERFEIPKLCSYPGVDCDVKKDDDCVYFCGHSLGLQPKSTESHVQQVVSMNSLTTNLHLLMTSFYQPTKGRYKILIEQNAFPSDYYVVVSQIRLAGYDEDESLILVKPRENEELFRMEDIIEVIEKEGDSIALILLPGVYFITGQAFDMKAITEAGHKKGCYVGYDLAHAVGNIELHLHEWGVDFACWCTYKYLNSGPGGIGAAFLHRRFDNTKMKKLLGWRGHKETTRLEMTSDFDFAPGLLQRALD